MDNKLTCSKFGIIIISFYQVVYNKLGILAVQMFKIGKNKNASQRFSTKLYLLI